MKALVTGANGFVGKVLCEQLLLHNYSLLKVIRSEHKFGNNMGLVSVNSIDGNTDWREILVGIDIVFHLAARVHVMNDASTHPLMEYRRVNVEGTRRLAESAVEAGVKRFVYVSSIKANGEESDKAYSELDIPNPQDAYGVSKWEAEQVLHEISAKTGLEVVVVRPPLVYGEGVKGNFGRMMNILSKSYPLPLASIKNLRSFIYVGNLVDALILCSKHSKAANNTYLVSDDEDVSTPDLLRRLSSAMGYSVKLMPCNPFLIKILGKLLGKKTQVDRLLGSLQVDCGKIKRELAWQPLFCLDEGLGLSVKNFDKLV